MSLHGRFNASKLNSGYYPVDYFPVAAGNEATNKVSAHLKGIDQKLTRLAKVFSKVSHGFVVKDVLRYSGSDWVKAQADTRANSMALGIVTAIGTGAFEVTFAGYSDSFVGLTAGSSYYLSSSAAGGLITDLASLADSDYQKHIMFAISSTEAIVQLGDSRTKAVFFG